MIKTIPIELDGFHYNVIQMDGEKMTELFFRLSNLLSNFDLSALDKILDKEVEVGIVGLIQSLMRNADYKMIDPIIKALFNRDYLRFDKVTHTSEKFNAARHVSYVVSLADFSGADFYHVPILLFKIFMAHFSDFLDQLKLPQLITKAQSLMGSNGS